LQDLKKQSFIQGETIMPSIGWQEILIVLFLVLLIFGPKKLPEIGRSVGKSIKEFRTSTSENKE